MMSMGFIDQIMGAMGMEAAQTVTEKGCFRRMPLNCFYC